MITHNYENFEDAWFLVVFTGENPNTTLIKTWAKVLEYIDSDLGLGLDCDGNGIAQWAMFDDHDEWTHADTLVCDDKRLIWSKEVGECVSLEIIRILDVPLEVAIPKQFDGFHV